MTTAEKLAIAAQYVGESISDENLPPLTREALSYTYARLLRAADKAEEVGA